MSKLLWIFTLVGAVLGALVLVVGLMAGSMAVADDDIDSLREEVAAMIEVGYEMSPLRESSNTNDVVQCMGLMERYQPEAAQLRERISAQPDSDFKFHLGMAAVDLNRCVSCVPGAVSSCDDASKTLAEADELL